MTAMLKSTATRKRSEGKKNARMFPCETFDDKHRDNARVHTCATISNTLAADRLNKCMELAVILSRRRVVISRARSV